MALVAVSAPTAAAATQPALTAPNVSETMETGWDRLLEFEIGATATTVTVVRPGNHPHGDAIADYIVGGGALTSTRRLVRVGKEFADPTTGLATILFSQVTGVLARQWQI